MKRRNRTWLEKEKEEQNLVSEREGGTEPGWRRRRWYETWLEKKKRETEPGWRRRNRNRTRLEKEKMGQNLVGEEKRETEPGLRRKRLTEPG